MIDAKQFSNKDLKWKIPFGCVISGPSSSGKSTFIRKLIAHSAELIEPDPQCIAYFYGQYSSLVPDLQKAGVLVQAGVPTDEMLKRLPTPALVILDDLLYTIDERSLAELFTRKSHHTGNGLGVIFVTQSLFEKKCKVIRLNSMYIVLMRAPNSALSIRNLGVQLFPRQLDFFLDAYRQATQDAYKYLLIDLHPTSDPLLRLRSNIFKEEGEHQTIYAPKNASAI